MPFPARPHECPGSGRISLIRDVLNKPNGRKKVLVLAQLPRTAIFFHKILAFIGISSVCLTSDMRAEDRGQKFVEFNDEKGPKVIICTYDLKLAGLNAHHQCCTVTCLGQLRLRPTVTASFGG